MTTTEIAEFFASTLEDIGHVVALVNPEAGGLALTAGEAILAVERILGHALGAKIGTVTYEAATKALADLRATLLDHDQAADAALDHKFPPR